MQPSSNDTGASPRDIKGAQSSVDSRPLHIGIVGATGNVGTVMAQVLAERNLLIASIRLFASERSAGRTMTVAGHTAVVEDLATADPVGLDVALFSAGADRAGGHAPRFADAGVWVIDNSSAFRMDEGVPLVVPEVNAGTAVGGGRIIANPNCSTIQLLVVLKPLHDAFQLERVQVTTFQAVSGTGLAAMNELHDQAQALAPSLGAENLSPQAAANKVATYPHQIAFNVLPHCDSFDAAGNTKEELKLVNESRKILGIPDLRIAATCVRVPVVNAHSEAVHIEFASAATADDVRRVLHAAPGVTVVDSPGELQYPMPLMASGHDEVFVGRIRVDESVKHGCALFICADNLRKGAATNAIQILEHLVGAGVWSAEVPQPVS